MANQTRIDGEEQAALFHSYPCALYYVQSPSTMSHANSSDCRNQDLSPYPHDNFINPTNINTIQEATRFTLSRYSSSRGSNNSFLHEKKLVYDLQSHEICVENDHEKHSIDGLLRCHVDKEEEEDDGDCDCDGDGEERDGFWRLFYFDSSSSCLWISLQILWRLMVSLGVALLVFFLVTKPPQPKMSLKMGRMGQFGLGEGIDESGVTTKIMTVNCSLDLEIINKSKLFGLHIHPPTLEIDFGRLNVATCQGEALYVESDSLVTFPLYVGTKNRAMYGAGRAMQDMLESGKGLPLEVRVNLRSKFHIVWNLVRLKFRHRANCLLVLDGTYDRENHTEAYNSTCTTTTYA